MARGSWGDFTDKYGFNDGVSCEGRDYAARDKLVELLNKQPEASAYRAIAFDRPGLHNSCMIIFLAPNGEKTDEQLLMEWLNDGSVAEVSEPLLEAEIDELIEAAYESTTSKSLRRADGDADNADRARFAQKALDAYTSTKELGRYAEETPYTRIGDLIGDLLHLAQREYRPGEHGGDTEFDPLNLWERALSYYEEEVSEEVDAQPDQTV